MKRITQLRILPIVALAAAGGAWLCGSAKSADSNPPPVSPPPVSQPLVSVVQWTHQPAAAGRPDNQLRVVGQRSVALAPVAPGGQPGSPPIPPRPQPETIPQGPPAGHQLPAVPGSEPEAIDGSWKPIGQVSVSIAPPPGELPADLAISRFAEAGEIHPPQVDYRQWCPIEYNWEASGLCHGPLYFEELNLERYGYTWGIWQPVVSAVHFFGTIPLLPYKMVVQPPNECIYTLGYYRPGDRVPRQREHWPFKADAAMVETAVILGLVFVLP